MVKYICKRLIQMIIVLIAVSIASFFIIKIAPGDVLMSYITPDITEEQIEQLKEDLGLNDSIIKQYTNWVNNVVTQKVHL